MDLVIIKTWLRQFIRFVFIRYGRLFRRPTIKTIKVNQIVENTKIELYNNIMDLNLKISKQKTTIVDLYDRKDFLERTLIRLKSNVAQSEERDEMIKLWESDLCEVIVEIDLQAQQLQNLILEYSILKAT